MDKVPIKFGELKNDSFEFEHIEDYFQKRSKVDVFHLVSDKTCNDLDLNALFMFLDRTNSRVGQQYLYSKLRSISNDTTSIPQHEAIIKRISEDETYRSTIQGLLSRLRSIQAYYLTSLMYDEYLKPPRWFFVVRLLSFLSLFVLILCFVNPVFILSAFGLLAINIGIHYWNKRNLYQYVGSLPQLLRLSKVARALFKNEELKDLNPDLQKAINSIDNLKSRMIFFKLENGVQGDADALFGGIAELFKIFFLIEPLMLFGVLKKLDSRRDAIVTLFEFVGLVDSLFSIASLRKGLDGYCIPRVTHQAKELIANGMYHPLIENCVSNSIHVGQRSILLTGSNMSGKTSFIRTIGINVITGLTINTCFAEAFAMPPMAVYSALRISDDLLNDKSYYFEEVLTVKEMLDSCSSGKPSLFLLDEIFKGTNMVERISAGKAVLSYLARTSNIVFVSTHDIELADLLKNEYELFHFSERVSNNAVDFDYKLKEGKLTNRNAIKILQINSYPDEVIAEALEISKTLDRII